MFLRRYTCTARWSSKNLKANLSLAFVFANYDDWVFLGFLPPEKQVTVESEKILETTASRKKRILPDMRTLEMGCTDTEVLLYAGHIPRKFW